MKFASLLISLLLLACAPAIRAGTVTEKVFVPAHSEQYLSYMMCVSRDKNGMCTVNVPIYSSRDVPDAWYLRIKDGESQATLAVSQSLFDSIAIGDYLDCNDTACKRGTPEPTGRTL